MTASLTIPRASASASASAPEPAGRRRLREPAVLAGVPVALLVVLLGTAHGGYGLQDWIPLAPLLAVTLAALVVAGPARRSRLGLGGMVVVGALVALAAWTAVGFSVASDRSAVWQEVVRTATYAFVVAVVALAATSAAARRGVAIGVATGALGIALLALAELWRDPAAHLLYGRLLGPVGYHNALAAVLVLPVLPLVSFAALRDARGWHRGLALATLVVLSCVAVLPLSRGAALAGVLAGGWYLAVAPLRLRSLVAMLVPAATIAIGWGTLTAPYAGGLQGAELRDAAHAIVVFTSCAAVLAFVVGIAWEALDRVLVVPRRVTRVIGTTLLAAMVAAAGVGGVATLQRTDGIGGFRHTIVRHFSDDPSSAASDRASISNNGRLPLWKVAVTDARSHPWTGVGAGNWASTYYAGRSRDVGFVRQPHSLALELAAERGLPALAAFLGFVLALGCCAVRRVRRGSIEERAFAAASAGAVGWVLVHAQLEWFWQFPVVLVPVLALAGTLVASRTAVASRVTAPDRRFTRMLRGSVAVAASVALLAAAMPLLLAEHHVAAAARAGSTDAAVEQLDAARRWNPVDAQIERELAARLDAAGRRREAAQAMRRQLELDRASWVSWVLLARHEAQIGHPAMARRYALEARIRNPLEPSLRDPRRIAAPAVLEDPVTRDAQRAA